MQKRGDKWQLVEPNKADADAGVVDIVTSSLATLEVQRVVDENPADLKQYGLDPPRIDVAFRLKGQKDFQQLLVGDKTPTGGDLYAETPNEKRVFLVSSFLESTFNKNTFALRDKAILKFDRDEGRRLRAVTDGPARSQFTRNGTDWRSSSRSAARADYAAVEGLLTRLSSTQMQKIVGARRRRTSKQYGLDRPA